MTKFLLLLPFITIIIIAGLIYSLSRTQIHNDLFFPTTTPTPAYITSAPTLLSPQPGSTIIGPLVIKGYIPKSWTFEGQFRVKLLDDKKQLILQDRVPVEWDNENTKDTLYFVESYNYHTTAKSGFLILENDNPSGLPENQKSMETPINFATSPSGTVYLFYANIFEDSKICDCVACQVVLPVARRLGISQTPIRDTLELLLRGEITTEEKKAGFSSEFPHPGFSVKSLNLKNGILTIEFIDLNGFSGGGSCRTGWLAAQITSTMKQFSDVKLVRYLPDSIFQP